jgi:hypothetical protein
MGAGTGRRGKSVRLAEKKEKMEKIEGKKVFFLFTVSYSCLYFIQKAAPERRPVSLIYFVF